MILGAGWAFLGLVVVGLAMLVLVPGCGLVVVNESPAGEVDLAAPALVEADPVVEARTASVAAMSLARVRRQARSTALRIRNVGCDRVRAGSGFALDSKLLLAGRDVVPGAGDAVHDHAREPARRARERRADDRHGGPRGDTRRRSPSPREPVRDAGDDEVAEAVDTRRADRSGGALA